MKGGAARVRSGERAGVAALRGVSAHDRSRSVLRKIAEVGLVPVVRAQSADEAMKVVDAIREGGVSVLEITMTVPGALGVIEQVARRFGADVAARRGHRPRPGDGARLHAGRRALRGDARP